ncbi:hypothetical protein GCM10020254_40120 [Streptomyces goshikiensis]
MTTTPAASAEPEPAPEPAERGLRDRKKRETRDRLAHVATLLFIERGFEQVTIAEIAEAAHVSKMTVSNYFPLKEDLVFDAGQRVLDSLARTVRERTPGESALHALRRAYLATLGEQHPLNGRCTPGFARLVHDSPLAARPRAGDRRTARGRPRRGAHRGDAGRRGGSHARLERGATGLRAPRAAPHRPRPDPAGHPPRTRSWSGSPPSPTPPSPHWSPHWPPTPPGRRTTSPLSPRPTPPVDATSADKPLHTAPPGLNSRPSNRRTAEPRTIKHPLHQGPTTPLRSPARNAPKHPFHPPPQNPVRGTPIHPVDLAPLLMSAFLARKTCLRSGAALAQLARATHS